MTRTQGEHVWYCEWANEFNRTIGCGAISPERFVDELMGRAGDNLAEALRTEIENGLTFWESEGTEYTPEERERLSRGLFQFLMSIADEVAEMTIREITDTAGITRQAVWQAIRKGKLPARKSGATWLVRRADAQARWGLSSK